MEKSKMSRERYYKALRGFKDPEIERSARAADAEFEAAWRHALGQPPKRKMLKRVLVLVFIVAVMAFYGLAHACPFGT
jgi:hypothetical protein